MTIDTHRKTNGWNKLPADCIMLAAWIYLGRNCRHLTGTRRAHDMGPQIRQCLFCLDLMSNFR